MVPMIGNSRTPIDECTSSVWFTSDERKSGSNLRAEHCVAREPMRARMPRAAACADRRLTGDADVTHTRARSQNKQTNTRTNHPGRMRVRARGAVAVAWSRALSL